MKTKNSSLFSKICTCYTNNEEGQGLQAANNDSYSPQPITEVKLGFFYSLCLPSVLSMNTIIYQYFHYFVDSFISWMKKLAV